MAPSGKGVGIAFVDQAVKPHEAFGGRLHVVDCLVAPSSCLGPHGTYAAGVAAGRPIKVPFWSAAPDATIWSLPVALEPPVFADSLADALAWIVDHRGEHDIRVVYSAAEAFATASQRARLATILDRATRAGIVTVAPAGNGGRRIGCPADEAGVLAVGGYREQVPRDPDLDSVAAESNRGPARDGRHKPDVVECWRTFSVPGSSRSRTDDYDAGFGGTSAAAAMLVGRIATWFEANPRATADAMRFAITRTARRLLSGPSSFDDQGYGAVDPSMAIEAVRAITR
jgi:Subtilase family